MTTFQPGDTVNITIRAARIMEPKPGHDHILTVAYAQTQPGVFATIELTRPAAGSVSIEPVASVGWPPRPGDLWRDKHDELWFIHTNPVDKDGPLLGRTTGGARWTDDAGVLISDNAPLTLVYREG